MSRATFLREITKQVSRSTFPFFGAVYRGHVRVVVVADPPPPHSDATVGSRWPVFDTRVLFCESAVTCATTGFNDFVSSFAGSLAIGVCVEDESS